MGNISRRRFVRMLAGAPFLSVAAPQLSATTQRDLLSRSQIDAVELILRRLVTWTKTTTAPQTSSNDCPAIARNVSLICYDAALAHLQAQSSLSS